MPMLKTGAVNVNDPDVVKALLRGFSDFIPESGHYRTLKVRNGVHFSTSPEALPTEAGWYVIVAGNRPVYVGEADSLNGRLNSDNGSRDNFLNPQRTSDPERNLIKKFSDLGFLPELGVWFVTERELSDKVGTSVPLSALDRGNIEKLLNICRGTVQEWLSARSTCTHVEETSGK